ncbi:MAG TPA: hypothetical protein VFN78_13960 [Ktedonobacterales bacterium]|nr:hypothetical protein [Ktedonobacterales bacterium]
MHAELLGSLLVFSILLLLSNRWMRAFAYPELAVMLWDQYLLAFIWGMVICEFAIAFPRHKATWKTWLVSDALLEQIWSVLGAILVLAAIVALAALGALLLSVLIALVATCLFTLPVDEPVVQVTGAVYRCPHVRVRAGATALGGRSSGGQ